MKGNAISLNGFFELLQLEEICEALEKSVEGFIRMNPWKVDYHQGMSGAKDFYISWIGESGRFPRERRRHLLHVSMYDKLNEGVEIFTPDLLELIPELGYFLEDEEIYFEEISEISMGGYKKPIEQFVPVMAYQSEEDYLKNGIEKGIRKYKNCRRTRT